MKLKPPADMIIPHPNGNTTEVHFKTSAKKPPEQYNHQLEVYRQAINKINKKEE